MTATEPTEYETLHYQNNARIINLINDGVNVDPLTMLRVRVDALTAIVLAPYPEEAGAQFELIYERIVSDLLGQLEENNQTDGANETTDNG